MDEIGEKHKELNVAFADLCQAIGKTKPFIAILSDEIVAFALHIKDLDKFVVEAAENRKEEDEDCATNMVANNAAVELFRVLVTQKNALSVVNSHEGRKQWVRIIATNRRAHCHLARASVCLHCLQGWCVCLFAIVGCFFARAIVGRLCCVQVMCACVRVMCRICA